MNKKIVFSFVVGIGVLIILAIVSSGSSKTSNVVENNQNNQNLQQSFPVAEKVEVFYFHATQRCPTCIRIGQLAKATVEERFSERLKSGKIEFREINVDLPEDKVLAEKFKASGSALFINSIISGQDNIKEDIRVWQLVGGTDNKFKDYLENKLNSLMGI
jgi:hypothetical protein